MPYGVRKVGDKWEKYKKDTGKRVSMHDSEEKARASIRAIYASKHASVNDLASELKKLTMD